MIEKGGNILSKDILKSFKEADRTQVLVDQIEKLEIQSNIKIMEVCGGHTHAIRHFGLPALLPDNIELISGPGCPVCVTESSYINKAIAYASNAINIIATYGDLIRVPGYHNSLEQQKAQGADIRIVNSPLEVLEIAIENAHKNVIFLGIGFETTTPGTALLVLKAKEKRLKNVFVLSAHKVMPPALAYVLMDEKVQINGILAPGHVTAITGSHMYNSLSSANKTAVVVSGFEPVDILQSVYMLLKQIKANKSQVEIQYKRFVSAEGNQKARAVIDKVFKPVDAVWRGFGNLKNSGLALNKLYQEFDADVQIPVEFTETGEPAACICGSVLKGLNQPTDCKLYATQCNPINPIGACMVSTEGTCHAYYKYNSNM